MPKPPYAPEAHAVKGLFFQFLNFGNTGIGGIPVKCGVLRKIAWLRAWISFMI